MVNLPFESFLTITGEANRPSPSSVPWLNVLAMISPKTSHHSLIPLLSNMHQNKNKPPKEEQVFGHTRQKQKGRVVSPTHTLCLRQSTGLVKATLKTKGKQTKQSK